MTTSTSKNFVFYADDDPDDLQLVLESFSHYANNVEVITASDGGEALRFFQEADDSVPTPCLIILDINMPEVNGKDLLVKIRQMERFADVPVVLFTTSTQPMDMIFAKKYNAGFVTKPLNVKQMEIITDQFIDHCAEDIQSKMRKLQ
jgi:CheY-like chemotaxis protein